MAGVLRLVPCCGGRKFANGSCFFYLNVRNAVESKMSASEISVLRYVYVLLSNPIRSRQSLHLLFPPRLISVCARGRYDRMWPGVALLKRFPFSIPRVVLSFCLSHHCLCIRFTSLFATLCVFAFFFSSVKCEARKMIDAFAGASLVRLVTTCLALYGGVRWSSERK